MNLSDYVEEFECEHVLVMGMPKSGKSTLVADLSKKFKLHWIDNEGGIKTLLKLPPDQQANINLIRIPDSASIPMAAETCLLLFKLGKANICHKHGKIECAICKKDAPTKFTFIDLHSLGKNDILVLDSGTQLGLSILAHILRKETLDYKPERDDWGNLKRVTEFFKSQFQTLPCNFICICQILEAKAEDGRTKLYPSFGSGPMSTLFGGAFDHVVYIEQKNAKHVSGSMTNYNPSVDTGSRTDFDITKYNPMSLAPLFDGTHKKAIAGKSPAQQAMDNLKEMVKP